VPSPPCSKFTFSIFLIAPTSYTWPSMIKGHSGRVVSTFIPRHVNHTCLSHATTPRLVSSRLRVVDVVEYSNSAAEMGCRGSKCMLSSSYTDGTRISLTSRWNQGRRCTYHNHMFSCVKHVFQHVYTSRDVLISFPQREMMAAAVQWRAFTKFP
jgi:hypothetical protein